MNTISDLTYKVVALSQVSKYNTDECVDWALEMVLLDYDTPSLLIIAGLRKPTNFFEVNDYLRKALSELDIKEKQGEEAVMSYASFFIRKIAEATDIRANLEAVYGYCQSQDYEKRIYDFYLLRWAWDDFDYNNEYTPYWEEATRDTIETIVIATAAKWLEESKELYQLRAATTGQPWHNDF